MECCFKSILEEGNYWQTMAMLWGWGGGERNMDEQRTEIISVVVSATVTTEDNIGINTMKEVDVGGQHDLVTCIEKQRQR